VSGYGKSDFGGSLGGSSGGGGNCGALPAELQQFVVERAREVSMLRERLARAQSANQASSRRWGRVSPFRHESSPTSLECDSPIQP